MRHIRPLLLCAVLLPLHTAQAQRRVKVKGPEEFSPGGPCDTAAWKLVFHDEFNGDELDRTKWVTYFTYSDDGSDRCSGCRVMGNSNTIFRDEQVSVKDGMLRLGVVQRSGTWYDHAKDHEAGLVHSIGDARFSHGRFEARCRIPKGRGLWPAFWGFGGETEIDFFEFCGETTNRLNGSLHRWGALKHSGGGHAKAQDLSTDFHVYAVEWDPGEVRWYIDGRLVQQRARFVDRKGRPLPACGRPPGTHATAPYFPRSTDAINLILNLAVSAPKDYCKGPKKPKPWPKGTALLVDHVRVYQRRPQEHLHDLCDTERRLAATEEGPIRPGEHRQLYLQGPVGDVRWSVSNGLWIARRTNHEITVVAKPDGPGNEWVRAEWDDDPCQRGLRSLESAVPVIR